MMPPTSRRILFTTSAGLGHVHPLLPLASALREMGRTIAFAGPATSLRPLLAPLGYEVFVAGRDSVDDDVRQVLAEALRLGGRAGERYMLTHLLARINTGLMVPDLLQLCAEWRPDILVHEINEFGAWLVGERLGIPHCCVQAGSFEPANLRGVAEAVEQFERIRAAMGLPPDPEMRTMERYRVLIITPHSLRPATIEPSDTTRLLRPIAFDQTGDERLPAGWAPPQGLPLVYATLGSEIPRREFAWPRVFQALVTGLGTVECAALVTVGRDRDPSELGTPPARVRVERYVPQSLVIPHAAAVVSHGGHGTLLAAVEHGLPQVIIPFFADQPFNAARAAACGASITIEPPQVTPAAVSMAVTRILTEPAWRVAAQGIQREIAAMPAPATVAADVVALAR
jgi:MGT family glycosyltransferase